MISDVDAELLGWLREAAAPSTVELGPPAVVPPAVVSPSAAVPRGAAGGPAGGTGTRAAADVVSDAGPPPGEAAAGAGPSATARLHLLDVVGRAAVRGAQDVARGAELRYLVTVSGDPARGHMLLDRLLVTALGRPGLTLEPDPPEPVLWLAFGAPPQPCFVLRVPHVLRHDIGHAPPVTRPLRVRTSGLGELVGTVRTAGGVPVPYAEVSLAGATPVVTDDRGAFRLSTVEGAAGGLAVAFKGRPVRAAVAGAGTPADPYVVQIQTETGVA